MIHSFVLANGLRAFVAPTEHVPMVSVHIVYPFDPLLVPDGVPHLAEHLMFEQTLNIPNGDVDRWLRIAGGHSTAWTTWDAIHINSSVSSNNLDLLLYVELERASNLCVALTEESLENQRKVIAQEMWNQSVQKDAELSRQLRKRLLQSHPVLSKEVMGLIYDIESADKDTICTFLENWINPRNGIWLVSGDVDVEELKMKLSAQSLEDFPVYNSVQAYQVVPKKYFQSSDEDRLFLVWQSPSKGSSDEWWINEIMHTAIHKEWEFNEQVYGWNEQGNSTGWMGLEIHTKQPQLALDELQGWLVNPIIDWDVAAERAETLIQKELLTNQSRVLKLHDCIGLSVECESYIHSVSIPQKRELATTINRYLNIDEASILWQGTTNWLQGEDW